MSHNSEAFRSKLIS